MFITQEVVPLTFFFLRIFVVNFKINNIEYKKHTSPIVLVMPGWKQLFLSLDVNWKRTASELIQNIWWWCSSKACLLYKRWFHLYIYIFAYLCFLWISKLIMQDTKRIYTSPIVLVMPGWKRLFLSLDVNWKWTVSELIQNIWWWCSSKACLLYKKWFHLYIYFFFAYLCFLWISKLIMQNIKRMHHQLFL